MLQWPAQALNKNTAEVMALTSAGEKDSIRGCCSSCCKGYNGDWLAHTCTLLLSDEGDLRLWSRLSRPPDLVLVAL